MALGDVGESFVIPAGGAALFEVHATQPPVIVQPTDPGGGGVVLFTPEELGSLSAEEVVDRAQAGTEQLMLGVGGVDAVDLHDLEQLADYAEAHGLTVVLQIGDG